MRDYRQWIERFKNARVGTKNHYIKQMFEVLQEYVSLEAQLMALIDAGKVNGGCYYVYGLSFNYSYRWLFGRGTKDSPKSLRHSKLYGWAKEETKLWEYRYHLEQLKEDLQKLANFLASPGQGPGWKDWKGEQ